MDELQVIKHGREMGSGNWLIYGAGKLGMELYIQCRNSKNKNIYIYDSEPEKTENLFGRLDKDGFLPYIFNNDCNVVISIKSEDAITQIVDQLISDGVDSRHIFKYIPETRDDIFNRVSKLGFFNGKEYHFLLNDSEIKNYLIDIINSKQPFLFSRWGSVEGNAVYAYRSGVVPDKQLFELQNNAGVFPTDADSVWRFVKTITDAAKSIDILCVGFWELNIEDLYRWYSPNALLCQSTMIYPFFEENSWTYALEGKRVLVIHPFAELIEKQYVKRVDLFSSPNILPEFELITYKSVQSMGGHSKFASWFEALNKMENDIGQIDFDIALIGCGAYGMPLGAFIKDEMYKQAMHIGGSLQILFGIKGKRWEGENYNYDKLLYNDAWVRPTDDLKPANYKNVEEGCYW
jgi:hypothetical protein